MKTILNKMTFGLALGILFTLSSITQSSASSHREAPLISQDPLADNTDVYAFRSPDDPNTITIIANYIPMQLPHGGPNYYSFGENIRYEIHIDNDASTPGDDVTYRFTFNKVNEDPTTFFNIRLGSQNQKNTYTLEKSTDGGATFTTIVENGFVPPYNVGDRSIEGAAGLNTTYEALFNNAITTASSGESVFAGHVEDPFFVDLGGIFDLGDAPRQNGTPRDGLACMNVSSLAIKVNIADLQKDGLSVDEADNILDGDFVIGVWASASRQEIRTLNTDGTQDFSGEWVQVSRLGMPLTNEVVIPVGDKDYWNSITPYEELADNTLDGYFYNPELALYMDEDNFASAVPAFEPLRIQRNSLQSFDFGNGQDGLFPLKNTAALDGTVLADGSPYEDLLLPGAGQPRSVDLWPIFHTGVPNARPYQLATGKAGDPLAAGKPFINNFLPSGGDMLRLNMATPVTPRDDENFSSLGLVAAAVAGLTDPNYTDNADLEFIPNMDGFPNGRRLEDDVSRIELQAVAGIVLSAIGLWEDDYNPEEDDSPVTDQLLAELGYTTGVEENDVAFQSTFPYEQLPFSGTSPCSGEPIVYEQPEVLEPTPIVEPVCDNFNYYLTDHSADDGISDIYQVNFVDGNAELNYIATSEIEVHIAFNPMNSTIYAISKHENSYRTLDPTSGEFGPTVSLGDDYGEITAAVFNSDGKLLIGSQDNNAIYTVNVSTNAVSSYDTYSPVFGGDLAFASDGMLYLATRVGSGLYENYPAGDMMDQLIGDVPDNVTGMAITDLDNLLISSRGNTALELRTTDGGDPSVSYPVMLNGEPYTLRDGDMASGCDNNNPIVGECDSFETWYVNHGDAIDGSDLYNIEFTEGGLANMTYIENVPFEAHIAFDAMDNITYIVNADGSSFRVLDATTVTFMGDVALSGADFSKITAAIYNPLDGLLYVGDDNLNKVYTVDVSTGVATYYADAPVSGGDLAIIEDGSIYLATRTGNSLYEIVEGGSPVLINTIDPTVTGMSRGIDAMSLFISNKGSTEFTQVMASDGSVMATYTATLDGSIFSLSNGDMAAGCADENDGTTPPVQSVEPDVTLSSYPNPTSGNSEVVFSTADDTRALIEVYDMNGRKVATLYNEVAKADQEYRLSFDGNKLPNGIYIYRLTTNDETIMSKFMIAR